MAEETKPLILIADDDPDLRRLVRMNLETTSCEIIEASDGESAIEQLVINRPNLIILDVMMPVLTGWEILRYIRTHEDKSIAATGVLMLTGIGETLNELSSPMYGADDFIDKPFKSQELLFKVRRVLAKVRKREGQQE
ncbi:MAG: response regulator [Proteobacteria bacterium]|nr:response regulator [Pseudomonadota bacterium]